MKCKMFRVSTSSEFSESEINEWLRTQPHIQIEHVRSDIAQGYAILIVIFYSDRKDKLNNLKLLNDE